MPTKITLSASSIRQFMSCRRRYWFEYVEGLKPLVRETPLSFGSAVHAGLECLFQSGPDDKLAITIAKSINGSYSAQELEDSGVNPAVALECVMAFNTAVRWRTWKFVKVEPWFEVSMGHGKWLRGRYDGIVNVNGSLFILENKTVYGMVSPRQLHHLLWDMQAGLYIASARKAGLPVVGMLYNYIPKPTIDLALATPMEKRRFTKDGKLYANQRETDETPDEYINRVRMWYAEHPEYFIQHIVNRNEAQVAAMIAQFNDLCKDVRATERDQSYYMNPSACSVLACPYAGVCLEDTPEAREANFTRRE